VLNFENLKQIEYEAFSEAGKTKNIFRKHALLNLATAASHMLLLEANSVDQSNIEQCGQDQLESSGRSG